MIKRCQGWPGKLARWYIRFWQQIKARVEKWWDHGKRRKGEFWFSDFAPSLSLSESLFLRSLLNFRRLSNVANFSFTKVFPKNNIEINLRELFSKMLSILILRKLFRKMLSSLIFAKDISQDFVGHNFYEICFVKKFSSFGCRRAVTRLIIATKLNPKFFSYPWDWSVEVSSSFFRSKI